ncbi:MAG TPA: choline-sulfatase, partial [Phycisphaerae bacterium]|nr:choline-sulfatase [Phycisphaerae bacterium]
LLLYPKCEKVLLFDLRRDPDEMVDLADKPQSKPILKKLFARLLELQAATGDKLDIKSVFGSLL